MGILDFFRSRPKNTASVAKERLRIIVAQERAQQGRGRPDYLPLLRREILEVIRKYVNVDPDAIDIHVEQDGDSEVLELSVALPDRNGEAPAANEDAAAAAGEA
jgi:cell division topological specificity factor